jgi:DNA-binding CsgD family transcriptional regulator
LIAVSYPNIAARRKATLSQPTSKDCPLTSREKDVLKLIADGYTSEGAAKILHISRKTLEAHRNRIMLKLGIHHLAGLVRYAISIGLTTAEANPELDQIRH